jgi:hypothetical protein
MLTVLISALFRRPCSAQFPFVLISKDPFLCRIAIGQHYIFTSTAAGTRALFSQRDNSSQADIFFVYVIK